jgi:CRP/FNR family transcriptional regulator, polysaccharide utilization system transcription regulator
MENCYDKNHNDCLSCNRRSAMFNILSTDELQLVNENKISIHYKAGEIIQKQGTFMSHVISINAGLVKLFLEGEKTSNTILRIVRPTSFIGGPGIYSDQLYHFTVSAMKDTSACFIDIKIFKNILNQNKAFATEFMKDFSINVISVYNRLMLLTQKQTAGRLAYALLYLFEEVYESGMTTISISRNDLADLSAISRESLAKVLRNFQNEGIIRMAYTELELLKPDTLRLIQTVG